MIDVRWAWFGSSPNYQLPDCPNSTLKSSNHPSPPGLSYDAIPCHSHKTITQCQFHTHGHKTTCPNPLAYPACLLPSTQSYFRDKPKFSDADCVSVAEQGCHRYSKCSDLFCKYRL